MTQQEILNLPHLKIAEVKPNMFVHVHAEDDYRITDWVEGDDIKNYAGYQCMFMPIRDTYDNTYRVITVAEHEIFVQRQREAIEREVEEMNKMNNRA